jgi:hypothetical protein
VLSDGDEGLQLGPVHVLQEWLSIYEMLKSNYVRSICTVG